MPYHPSSALVAAGRFLLALYFLLPGIMKFTAWDMHIQMMQGQGVPMPEVGLAVAGIASLVGAALLVTNRFVRFTALGFVLYILLVNFNLHAFWGMEEGVQAQHEMQNFIKNLGILAGLLVLAGAYPWRTPGLRGLAQSDRNYSAD